MDYETASQTVRYFVKNELMIGYEIPQTAPAEVDAAISQIIEVLQGVSYGANLPFKSIEPIRLSKYDGNTQSATRVMCAIKLQAPETEMDDETFLQRLTALEQAVAQAPIGNGRFVSPNWYTASSAPSIGGGLAMAPKPVIDNRIDPPFPRFTLPASMATQTPSDGPVQVFLLDTLQRGDDSAVSLTDVTTSIKNWAVGKNYPLSSAYTQWAPAAADGAFIGVAPYEKIQKMGEMLVPNHGLFVAGIISSIAENGVNITVLEALNERGVGNMNSLNACIAEIDTFARNNPTIPVIVNCSLTVYAPADAEQIELERRAANSSYPNAPLSQALYEKIQEKMQLWTQSGLTSALPPWVSIIAAAGNDGTDAKRYGIGVLGPRYPARFNQVIGVSSLDKKGNRATYSNRADIPNTRPDAAVPVGVDVGTQGFTTLGNVKSLYMGTLPSNTLPVSGLAQWKGTSFATAVVTGILARLLRAIPSTSPLTAEERLQSALAIMRGTGEPHQNAGGYILDVKQY